VTLGDGGRKQGYGATVDHLHFSPNPSVLFNPQITRRDTTGASKIPRVSHASPSAKNRTLKEATLPLVLHSGRNCTQGREAFPSAEKSMALGEGNLPRGRPALAKVNLHLTAAVDGTV
jgi:hypothetical protein